MKNITRHMLELNADRTLDFRTLALYSLVLSRVKGQSVLDAGCGPGHLAMALAQQGLEVTACDLDETMARVCKHKFERTGIQIDVHELSVVELRELGSGRFDTIACIDVIDYVDEELRAFQAIAACLRPGGRLVVSVAAMPGLSGERDRLLGIVRRYDKAELRRVLKEAGLEVIEARYWNAIGVVPYWVSERIFHRPLDDSLRKHGGRLRRMLNTILRRALQVENHLRVPLGLTLFAVAQRPPLGSPSSKVAAKII